MTLAACQPVPRRRAYSKSTICKPATAKKRRYRANQRHGVWIAPTPVSHELIEYLLWLKAITEAESESRQQIGKAIRELLDDAMAHDEKFQKRIR
jgi:hypothetical protein